MSDSTTTSMLLNQYCTTAMFINNTAATFIQNGRYSVAMEFLKSGLVLMKKLVNTVGSDFTRKSLSKLQIDDFVTHILRKAQLEHVFPCPNVARNPKSLRIQLFKVTSSEDLLSTLHLIRAPCANCTQRKLCYFIFESVGPRDIYTTFSESAHQMSGILLYNYAVTLMLVADQRTATAMNDSQGAHIQKLNKQSLRMLTLCENTISPIMLRTSIEKQCTAVILFCLVTTHAMIELSCMLKDSCLERQYMSKMSFLASIVHAIQSIIPPLDAASAATA